MTQPTKPSQDPVYKSVYSRAFLTHLYDRYVLGFNMKYVWGCPTDTVLAPFFSDSMSHRHIDIGVATGYLPAKILGRPLRRIEHQHLTLVDFNEMSLNASRERVLSASPATTVDCVQADILEPLPEILERDARSYDTMTMFNLFHCVPGGTVKLRAFSTYKELLKDEGVLAGCSVLGNKYATGWFSSLYLRFYNWMGIFNNWEDEREAFDLMLKEEFEVVETELVGMMLLFKASKPRRS
ncbi:hypothetical protein BFJ72_g3708 [Fusarium proliferatum]|uniref:Methyltransferase type 12 domain-containing protein n=1 Tax=Gibberella intermedia TaxID=948311 RepID=A0A365N4G3_GIBIN|nr:hypothetical protein FPRO05_12656 [Fusarium proliferatum]RKL45058.1 hypothetical protein BFJ72_g3708 [Fusarium proliferatum]